jgi:hypothetical protein
MRVLPIEDFSMTSGMHYVFPGGMRRMIIRRYPALERAVPAEDGAVRRFVALHRLGTAHGQETGLRE